MNGLIARSVQEEVESEEGTRGKIGRFEPLTKHKNPGWEKEKKRKKVMRGKKELPGETKKSFPSPPLN